MIDHYTKDEATSKLYASLTVHSPEGHFTLLNGVIHYKNRIWLAGNDEAQSKVMTAFHSAAIGGHSGFLVTYTRIKKLFAWPGMKNMVKQFVQHCSICQQAKVGRVKYPGLLQPLPVPDHAW